MIHCWAGEGQERVQLLLLLPRRLGEVYHWSPAPRGLLYQNKMTVEARKRVRYYFQGPLLNILSTSSLKPLPSVGRLHT